MAWGKEQRAVVLAGPPSSARPALIEVAVPGAAEEGGPLGRGEYQSRPGGVAGIPHRHLAVGQVRDLDAVAPLRAAPPALAPCHLDQVRGRHSITDAHSASPP